MVGADIDTPLELPKGACLDVVTGETRTGCKAWFVRAYHVEDTFKEMLGPRATLAGQPFGRWLGPRVAFKEIWPRVAPDARAMWNARVFPTVDSPQGYRDWLWMFDPGSATTEQKQAFLTTDRYSLAEIALLADMDAFYARRSAFCDTH